MHQTPEILGQGPEGIAVEEVFTPGHRPGFGDQLENAIILLDQFPESLQAGFEPFYG